MSTAACKADAPCFSSVDLVTGTSRSSSRDHVPSASPLSMDRDGSVALTDSASDRCTCLALGNDRTDATAPEPVLAVSPAVAARAVALAPVIAIVEAMNAAAAMAACLPPVDPGAILDPHAVSKGLAPPPCLPVFFPMMSSTF